MLVEGPYRHGKTSLVNAALEVWSGRERGLAVDADCSGVLTATDLARRLEFAFVTAHAEGAVEAALVERLETLSLKGPTSATAYSAAGEPGELSALLSVARDVCGLTGARALVCLDEFDDAAMVPGVLETVRVAREYDGHAVSFVFAGPEVAALRELTEAGLPWGDRATTVVVGTVDPELFAHEISTRFARTGKEAGEAGEIVAKAGAGHPQRTILLAWHLWELTPAGERATARSARAALTAAMRTAAPEFDLRWQTLHSNERRIVVALAHDIAPQGTKAQRATGLAGFGAAQRAVQGVKSSGVAHVHGDRLQLTDPLFAQWLRLRYSPATVEQDWQALRIQHAQSITRGM